MYKRVLILLLLSLQVSKSQNTPSVNSQKSIRFFQLDFTNSTCFNYSQNVSHLGSTLKNDRSAVQSYCPSVTLKLFNSFRYLYLRYDNLRIGSDVSVTVPQKDGYPLQPGLTLTKRANRLGVGFGRQTKFKRTKFNFDLGAAYYLNFNLHAGGNLSYVLSDSSESVAISYLVRSQARNGFGVESGGEISVPLGSKGNVFLSLVSRLNVGLLPVITTEYTVQHDGILDNFRNVNKGTTFSLGISVAVLLGKQREST